MNQSSVIDLVQTISGYVNSLQDALVNLQDLIGVEDYDDDYEDDTEEPDPFETQVSPVSEPDPFVSPAVEVNPFVGTTSAVEPNPFFL